jgi:hypothetical protein
MPIKLAIQSLNDAFNTEWHDVIAWDVTPETIDERKALALQHMESMLKNPVAGGKYTLRLVEITTTILDQKRASETCICHEMKFTTSIPGWLRCDRCGREWYSDGPLPKD